MRPLRLVSSLIVGAALLGSPRYCPAQAAGDHPLAIGVVYTSRVVRAMQEFRKLDSDLRAQSAGLAQQQRQKEVEIQQLQDHRDNQVKPGSQQWSDETDAIDNKRAELEVWKQVSSLKLDRTSKEGVMKIYDHITAAAAQVAAQQHLDLIISDPTPEIGPDMEKASANALQAALGARVILFANKKLDVTEDVITMVQANFAKDEGSSSVGPPPLPIPGPK